MLPRVMPELPEVETIVRQIRPQLVGRRITGARLHWARTLQRPTPRALPALVTGRTITRAWRRGKYFVLDLDGGDREGGGDAGLHLVGHLRMSGRLLVQQDAAPEHVRASFGLDDGRHLVFTDVRKFGRIAVVRALDEVLPALGPEPLGETFDGPWLRVALAARRRRLKPLLLDQSFVAGLGNIYVDEALHAAGLHPLCLSDRVARHAAEPLAAAIRAVLLAAIAVEGSSFDTFYRTPAGQPGRYQDDFRVYGRDGLPCRTCGRPIRKLVVAQRGTHVCTRCQPAPRARRAKA